eukprot:UN01395
MSYYTKKKTGTDINIPPTTPLTITTIKIKIIEDSLFELNKLLLCNDNNTQPNLTIEDISYRIKNIIAPHFIFKPLLGKY